MDTTLPPEVLYQAIYEQHHYDVSPQAFFVTWRYGVSIAGYRWFGDGTLSNMEQANSKWDLCPRMQAIRKALGVLSSGERLFLAAMASFYNANDGGKLLKLCGFRGLADLDTLDVERRQVIARLMLYYHGW